MSVQSRPGRVRPVAYRLFVGVLAAVAVLLCGPQGHAAEVDTHAHAHGALAAADQHIADAGAAVGAPVESPSSGDDQHGLFGPALTPHSAASVEHGCGRPVTAGDKYVPGGPAALAVQALAAARAPTVSPLARGDQRQLSGRSLLTEACVSRT